MLCRNSRVRLAAGARMFSASRAAAGGAVRAAVILQRDPIVIQQSKGFEAAADRYFAWLEYMSAERFPREFFFKKGSTAEKKWTELEAGRAAEWHFAPAAKPTRKGDKGKAAAAAAAEEAADDAAVVEDDLTSSTSEQRIEVQPRETAADAAGDVQSLERKLDRTLYLVVKDSSGQWCFPHGDVGGEELLHDAARRGLREACGGAMSVWTVGRGPVSHHRAGDHTLFFVKAHILAGQVRPAAPRVSEYKWITKEEMESVLPGGYWASVKDALSSV
ncbi:hypothetical protein IWQ57_002307 [Coemansia nantahalensis]|uniref:Uncharacterized protein n=1 Tax=Coemansia nantahalensis TaxID=2789366 RepID=A0ACC1K0K8_9FUNG|nr:hypothetical protein IWQ57_002307 [Coemansia nantahalensis]